MATFSSEPKFKMPKMPKVSVAIKPPGAFFSGGKYAKGLKKVRSPKATALRASLGKYVSKNM